MHKLEYIGNRYQTKECKLSFLARAFPSLLFYIHLTAIVFRASKSSRKGLYDGSKWVESSVKVLRRLEEIGIRIEIAGIENMVKTDGPVVFVGNHMSMMETVLLPAIIQPVKQVTFVVKESLLHYPIFKHVMRARKPISVTRTNPREDLRTVMTEGVANLQKGISIIVFPQTTRSHIFDTKEMSSIGVKLARKAGVPVIPLALKTDCWQNGKYFKDFGMFYIEKTAFFSFGEPTKVIGKGAEEQNKINQFITDKLADREKK